MSERITVYRGQDKVFNVKLRKSNGDPLSLVGASNIQIIMKKANRQNLSLDLNEVSAKRASITYSEVTFSADTLGVVGNSIILEFDGVHTISEITSDWNAENPSNTVSHNGDSSAIFPTKTIQLTGGQNSYYPVTVTDDKLGFVTITIANNETRSLRRGENQDVEFVIDFGDIVGGTRYLTKLRGKLDVYRVSI